MNKYYCSDEMLSNFDKWNSVSIKNNDNLKVTEVPNGIIFPLELSEGNTYESKMWGGVVDSDFNFVPESLQKRESGESSVPYADWYTGINHDNIPENIEYINEEVVFIGPIKKHFAHFYLESLSRMWYFLDRGTVGSENVCKESVSERGTIHQKLKIAFLTQDNDAPDWKNFDVFFELLGLKKSDMIEIKQPTQFKNVIIPEQSFILNKCYHQKYAETINKITETIKPAKYKKVFFSKKFNWVGSNRSIGDELAEDTFRRNGYKVFYPENMKVKEMLSVLKGCEVFAAQSASNAHNAIFCDCGTEVIILNRSAHVHIIQHIINDIKKLNVTYIDAFYPILPVNWSIGPFSFYFSRYFLSFLNDNKMTFNRRLKKKTSDKNFVKYIKAWSGQYSDKERFKYIENIKVNLNKIILNINDMNI